MNIVSRLKGTNTLHEVKIDTDLAAEPVTLTELKNHMRVDNDADDDLITNLSIAARKNLEEWGNLSFGVKTITAIWTEYGQKVTLPYGAHDSITSVTRIDYQNTETVLTAGQDYYVKGGDFKELWFNEFGGGVKVTFTTKAPITADLAIIKAAIKQSVSTMYEFREDALSGTIVSPVYMTARNLINHISKNTVSLYGF